MKTLVLTLLSFAAIALVSHTEATASEICTTSVVSVPDGNGGCCDVTVDYCYEMVGGVFTVRYGTVKFNPPQCEILMGPGLFNWLDKKIVYILNQQGAFNETIPNCPQTTTLLVETSHHSCYKLEYIPPGSNYHVYNPCGETYCVRRCTVCMNTSETDACNNNVPMLNYVGCINTYVPCVDHGGGGPGGCNVNTCSSN